MSASQNWQTARARSFPVLTTSCNRMGATSPSLVPNRNAIGHKSRRIRRHYFANGAAVSLEHIAREAAVSIATLYRHFPTRDELISAVYQQEVDMLIEAADQLMTEREPATALREWLMLFVDFLDAKYGMAEAWIPSSTGRNPSIAEPRTASTSPLRRWSPAGSGLEPFGTTSSRTIRSVPSLVWHTLDQQERSSRATSNGMNACCFVTL
jgi:hypothetical protein